MPVHIEEMTTDVTVGDGGAGPLSPAQLERLVELVLQRLEERQRDKEQVRGAASMRASAAPPSGIRSGGDGWR